MIGFLQPLLLLAAAAAAVPIILHLIRRRELRRFAFPAIRYLRRAEERYAQRLRLRHLLLLITRVLIVLLLAVAAAGPLIGRGGPADHEPTAIAIVFDESLSSGRVAGELRLLDLYRERVEATLELVGADDRIALFSAVRSEAGALAEGADAVRRTLRALDPTAGFAEPAAALASAVAWLRATDLDAREIHAFTDLQSVSLPDGDGGPPPADSGRGVIAVTYVPPIEAAANGAPGIPEPETLPLDAGSRTRVSVPLHWWGERSFDSTTVVRLLVDDDVVAVAEGPFGGVAVVTLPPPDSGWVQGYVEIDRQGLALDDRRYFSWFARPAPSVAVTGAVGDFMLRALRALESGHRLRIVESALADIWIAGAGERLEDALGAGRSVVVLPPANPLDLPRLNFRLERAGVPWRYEADEDATGASRLAPVERVAGLAGTPVSRAYRLRAERPAGEGAVLVELEDGRPWLVTGTTGEGAAYLLLASPLIPEATELPISAAMVPFIDVVVGDWARREAVEGSAYLGVTRVTLPARAREIRFPDGETRGIEGGSWLIAEEVGNYSVTDGAGVMRAFSVNAPLAESDLAVGDMERLEAALPEADWERRTGLDVANWRDGIFQRRRGRLAWRPLVGLLLVLSIVEASLAAAGRRRERPTEHGGAVERESDATGSAVH